MKIVTYEEMEGRSQRGAERRKRDKRRLSQKRKWLLGSFATQPIYYYWTPWQETPNDDRVFNCGTRETQIIRSVRAWISRGAKYGEPVNVIWQIKNKLNYGRY